MSYFESLSQLFADYAWYTDVRDVQAIGALYEDDGEMTIDIAGGTTFGPYSGRQTITDFIGSAMQDLTDQRRHVITNLRIEDAGDDEVTATAFLTLAITDLGEL